MMTITDDSTGVVRNNAGALEAGLWFASKDRHNVSVTSISGANLYSASMSSKKARQLGEAVSSGMPLADAFGSKAKVIPIASVTHVVTADDGPGLIRVHHGPTGSSKAAQLIVDESERAAVVATLSHAMGPVSTTTEKCGAARTYAPAGFVTALVALGVFLASQADGYTATGRRSGLKALLMELLGFLGPVGVIAIGVIGVGLMVRHVIQNPPHKQTITPDESRAANAPGAAPMEAAPAATLPVDAPVPTEALPPADWYPAPDGAGLQYWDGASWTEHRA